MAFRLRLVPAQTRIDFFRWQRWTLGASALAVVTALLAWVFLGLNFGIDFEGGTSIRTQSQVAVDVGAYRQALGGLEVGDVVIAEVFDPSFGPNQHVAQIRIGAQSGDEAVSAATLQSIKSALEGIDPEIAFTAVDSVGPKVSGELIRSALWALVAAAGAILVYIWMRFEWQYAVGALAALVHDVIVTIGVFAIFQLKFDLTIVAALLTILGYSINDTVVIFDRLRENLRKYKAMPLREVMNLSANETLSRTVMTTGTTLLALIAMLVFGGDVIRGSVFAITFGVVIGTYSSIYVAKNIVLAIGLERGGDGGEGAKAGGGAPASKA